MKIAIYSARDDEQPFFARFAPECGVELVMIPANPTLETIGLAKGCEAISVTAQENITADVLDAMVSMGVGYLSTRTIGFDHIDTAYAQKIGLAVGNVGYTPYSVAEYAVMLMMMTLRHVKTILIRGMGQDYTLQGVRGRLLHTATVGIVGTGKIGTTVATLLSGFGCRMLAFDPWQNPDLAGLVTYVTLEELLAQSDLVTLHAPATPENYHLMNQETLSQMKQGAVLINTARGDLVDSEALIVALEQEHLGAAALDLIEGERELYYRDKKGAQIRNRQFALLQAMPNVITTPHTAFFTDQSVSDMVEHSLRACKAHMG